MTSDSGRIVQPTPLTDWSLRLAAARSSRKVGHVAIQARGKVSDGCMHRTGPIVHTHLDEDGDSVIHTQSGAQYVLRGGLLRAQCVGIPDKMLHHFEQQLCFKSDWRAIFGLDATPEAHLSEGLPELASNGSSTFTAQLSGEVKPSFDLTDSQIKSQSQQSLRMLESKLSYGFSDED